MKKVFTIFIIFLVIFVVFYFSMWFLLGQVPVMKIQSYTADISQGINNIDNFPNVYNKIKRNFLPVYNKHVPPAKRFNSDDKAFYPAINKFINSYASDIEEWSSFSNQQKISIIFSFWGEFVNLALSRAEYAAKSVPLGAMKNVLNEYVNLYKKNKNIIESLSDELYEPIEKNYRTYVSLLKGKTAVLNSYLASGDERKIRIVCKEVANRHLIDMKDRLAKLFKETNNPELKYTIAETLLSLQYSDSQFDTYIVTKLQELINTPDFYDIISLIGSSGNKNYVQPLKDLMSTASDDIKSSLQNAIVKING